MKFSDHVTSHRKAYKIKHRHCTELYFQTRMWVNAQRHSCPAEHRWRPLFSAAKFG